MPKTVFFDLKSPCDGLTLSAVKVVPDGEIRCVLQMVHGMAEHKERYIPMMEYLSERGILCAMHDHRGHGGSRVPGGERGYFGGGGDEVLRDAKEMTDSLKREYPDVPVVLYGHSMGCLTARAYRLKYGAAVRGYVFSGNPGGNTTGGAGRLVINILKPFIGMKKQCGLMDGIVTGAFAKPFKSEGLRTAWLTRDRAIAEAYANDPECGFPFTLDGYSALMDLIDLANLKKDAGCRDVPVLFVSGEKDPCMPDAKGLERTLEATRASGCDTLKSIVYPGMRHEVHNELGRETVYDDICRFIDSVTGTEKML